MLTEFTLLERALIWLVFWGAGLLILAIASKFQKEKE